MKIIVLYILFLHNTDPKSTRIEEMSGDREERGRLLRETRAQKGLQRHGWNGIFYSLRSERADGKTKGSELNGKSITEY